MGPDIGSGDPPVPTAFLSHSGPKGQHTDGMDSPGISTQPHQKLHTVTLPGGG